VPRRAAPVVTVMLAAANVVAFVYQISLGMADPAARGQPSVEAFLLEFGLVPCRLTGSCPWDFPHPFVTVFTSMFLHGGLFHIASNLLYLWIFGDNVEGALGHGRFLLFYLACGVAAALGQTMVSPTSEVPMIGASGAVSGVLGAYLLLFPYATILTLVTFGFFIRFVRIPAIIVLGFWIVVQLMNGFLALGTATGGGVAWFAHIGGFVAGLGLLFVLNPRSARRA
jgi:membrane associated rhomboid family serine protease